MTASPTTTRTVSITWTCEVCKKPIPDGAGYLTVHYGDLNAHDDAVAAWEAKRPPEGGLRIISGTDLLDHPPPVRWHILHRRCDPRPDSCDDYWIAVERIRTPAQAIRWAAHLLGKRWIQDTTWDDVLRKVADQLREQP